ncbi:MAG: hypothetical protein Tsb0027_25970 [Wenzhouxiangellaceae bacterium]
MNNFKNSLAAVGMSAMLLAGSALAQDNYVDWAAAGKPDLAPVDTSAPDAPLGGLTTFADQASFDTATGGFPAETFDNGATAAGAVNTCTEPVNSASNDACFAPGDLIDGFSLTSSSGGGIVVLGDGFIGQPTAAAGANTFGDSTNVTFAPEVTAVAFDAYSGAPTVEGADVTVTALDGGGATIGSVTITTTADNVSEFFGFTSAVPIASITVEGIGGTGELIDNLQFGDPAVGPDLPPPPQVPTLSQFSLLLLAGLMLVVGVFAYRRFAA